MRVLLHAGVDLSQPGGIETHVRELAAGLMSRGHEIEISGSSGPCPPLRMVREVIPGRYGVVHFHGGRWPRELDGHPHLVSTLHFCVAAKMATYVRIGRLRTLANLANWRAVGEERSLVRGTSRLIAVSERLRQDFERHHGLDPARVTVISNGYVPRAAGEDRAALRQRYGLDPAAPVLLTVGRDDFVKGYRLLARAWEHTGDATPDAVWVTVGGRARARAPGRLVTGPVPHGEVASWIAAADFGAFPSWYEGGGIALLEMLGGGLFTLAHDVGIATDVIRAGVNGAIVAPTAEAWRAAFHAALERPPGRVPGLDGCYAWPAIVERTERVYQEIAGAG